MNIYEKDIPRLDRLNKCMNMHIASLNPSDVKTHSMVMLCHASNVPGIFMLFNMSCNLMWAGKGKYVPTVYRVL